MSLLAYLLLLPASVWLLGAVFSLFDRGDRATVLGRIAVRGLPFVAVALVLGDRAAVPALAAAATVATAHVAWSWLSQAIVRRGRLHPNED